MRLILTFLAAVLAINLPAQTTAEVDEHADDHGHHLNEIGIANSLVYFTSEEIFAYGLHLHYIRNIAESNFGVGLGFERVFDEHKHNTIGLVGTYRPIEGLNVNVSPGLVFEDGSSGVHFALHLETSYEFEIRDFHIGPAFEFAYETEDYHISLGAHIGYGF